MRFSCLENWLGTLTEMVCYLVMVLVYHINWLHTYSDTVIGLTNLQFALLIKVENAFFEVVHLAKDQGLIKHCVVTPQQGHSLLLQDRFSLPKNELHKKAKLFFPC